MTANPPKSRVRLLLLVLVCLTVAAAVWFALRQGPHQPTSTANQPSVDGPLRPARTTGKRLQRGEYAPAADASEAVAALVGDQSLRDLDVIIGLRRIVEDGGRKIEERLEALDHMLNLIPNEDPTQLRELAARPVIPDEVRQRLTADACNRPPRLQGDILLSLMKNAAGDSRKELLTQLTGLVGEDVAENLGEDVAAWRKAIDQLPENP